MVDIIQSLQSPLWIGRPSKSYFTYNPSEIIVHRLNQAVLSQQNYWGWIHLHPVYGRDPRPAAVYQCEDLSCFTTWMGGIFGGAWAKEKKQGGAMVFGGSLLQYGE